MTKPFFFASFILAALLPCVGFGSQPDYTGTDDDEVLDASDLIPDGGWIDGGGGDDTITLTGRRGFISGPGDDIVLGSGESQIGFNENDPFVDLLEGYVLDGFDGRDTVSGVTTIHLWGGGGELVGSSQDEKVYAFGGEKKFNLGGGQDRVIYYNRSSTEFDFIFDKTKAEIREIGSDAVDLLENVEFIEFTDRTISVEYEAAEVKAKLIEVVYSFSETEFAPEYEYAGETIESKMVRNHPQAVFKLDLNDDGIADVVSPNRRAYQTGLDTRAPFIALTTSENTLKFDQTINAQMPVTAGSRKSRPIRLMAFNTDAFITVQHETGDNRGGDLTLITKNLEFDASTLIPTLPGATSERPHRVNAHSLAVGDFDGDGDDDAVVGAWFDEDGAYLLWQQDDGMFTVQNSEFLKQVTLNWPLSNPEYEDGRNLLLELAAADVNSDGLDDLVTGWGHGSASRMVFINQGGRFSVDSSFPLPESIYGIDNQLSLDTFAADFDLDGDVDLILLWSRYKPFYDGNYLQILRNDGGNEFVDVTNDAMLPESPYTKNWNEHWTILDVNGDGYLDIAGQATGDYYATKPPFILINTSASTFGFRPVSIPWDNSFEKVLAWGDFSGDGSLNFLGYRQVGDRRIGPALENEFALFSVEGIESISAEPASKCKGPEPCFPIVEDVQCQLGKRLSVKMKIKSPESEEPEPSGYEVWCSSASTPQSSIVATANFIGGGTDTNIRLDTSQLGSTPYECYAEAWNSAGYSSDAEKSVFPVTSHKFNVELELQSEATSPPQLFKQLLRMVGLEEETTSDC